MYERVLVLGVLAACTAHVDLAQPSPPPTMLVATVVEPPGANCPYGGVAIETGTDDNSDGVLEAGEVATRDYACTPGAGLVSLMKLVPEPPGANCPYGGTAVESGVDADRDGVLETGEVTATTYVCAPAQALIRVEAEPPGPNCGEGGTAVLGGLDTNADGVLESAEVTSTSYVCSPLATLQQLVDVIAEPAGAHCAAGGQAIRVGYDLDGNGILVANEVTSISYTCNAAPSTTTLVRVVVEPPGANCAAGGRAILVGVDVDHDGYLEASEVQSTSYVCKPTPTIEGDVHIRLPADVDALAGVTRITGSLIVDSPVVTSLDLPALQSIGGLTCGGALECIVASIALPNLVEITGALQLTSAKIVALDLSHLAHAGSVSLWGTRAPLSFPRLASCDEFFAQYCAIGSLDLSLLEGGWVLLSGGTVPSIVLPRFASGTIDIESTAPISSVSFPAFTNGALIMRGAHIQEIDAPVLATGSIVIEESDITTLSFPALTSVTALGINVNQHLVDVSVPLLEHADKLSFEANPGLPNCEALALWTRLGYPPATIDMNDATATCN